MATETLKLIVGFGEPLFGRLLVHDGLDATWRSVPYGAPAEAVAPQHQAAASDASSDAASDAAAPSAAEPAPLPVPTPPVPADDVSADAAGNEISSAELADLLAERQAGRADFVLVDIREPWEREVVAIDGSALVPMAQLLTDQARTVMEPGDTVILYCHHGVRSEHARDVLREHGWPTVTHLTGGIDDWVRRIEPGKPRY
jgi:rhodanese-related sulfurtransferase